MFTESALMSRGSDRGREGRRLTPVGTSESAVELARCALCTPMVWYTESVVHGAFRGWQSIAAAVTHTCRRWTRPRERRFFFIKNKYMRYGTQSRRLTIFRFNYRPEKIDTREII
jgi:hypothetical protein